MHAASNASSSTAQADVHDATRLRSSPLTSRSPICSAHVLCQQRVDDALQLLRAKTWSAISNCCLCLAVCVQVKSEWNNYESSFGKEAGEGIKDRSKTTQLVDVFYSLVRHTLQHGFGACTPAVHVCLTPVMLVDDRRHAAHDDDPPELNPTSACAVSSDLRTS
jgi:hypothetical protein